MNTDLHFSSKTAEWSTPDWFYLQLHREFGFILDAAAAEGNSKSTLFFTAKEDGLAQSWWLGGGRVWVNPPYGRGITGKWVEKAYKESLSGVLVVMLLPARTDTIWFHNFILNKAAEVRFIKGRLKFGGSEDAAPFPSMIVVFQPHPYGGDLNYSHPITTKFSAYENKPIEH